MALAVPVELKKITPFIRRAEELDRDKSNPESRLVAYYCRQYAVHAGIEYAQSPASKAALGNILNDLETEKVAMSSFTRDESKFLCRQFADKIFDKADQEDRAGQAGKTTAKTFYAAATFMEIVQQFYPDDDESEEREEAKKKVIYAKWKSTDILKAMKEGREPTPGGYAEQRDDGFANGEDLAEAPPSAPLAPPAPPVSPPSAQTPATDFTMPPAAPAGLPSGPVPIAPPDDDDDALSEAGTEVELGPPPAYPGPVADESSEVFQPMPPPVVAPKRAEPAPSPKKASSIFGGFGKKKDKKFSKDALADARELTEFALAALDAKDGDLAATRLRQALDALGN